MQQEAGGHAHHRSQRGDKRGRMPQRAAGGKQARSSPRTDVPKAVLSELFPAPASVELEGADLLAGRKNNPVWDRANPQRTGEKL